MKHASPSSPSISPSGSANWPPGLTEADIKEHKRALVDMDLLDKLVAICARLHVRFDDVLSESRLPTVVRARDACCLYLRSLEMSFPEIGRVMLRDHTTVMASVKKAKRREGNGDGTPPAAPTAA